MRPGVNCSRFCSITPTRVDLAPFLRLAISCGVPFRNASIRRGRARISSIRYTLIVTGAVTATSAGPASPARPPSYQAYVAYTTSRPPPHDGEQPVLSAFSAEQAAELNQRRPFWLHLQRVAFLPVTPQWFPRLPRAASWRVCHRPGGRSLRPRRRGSAGGTPTRWCNWDRLCRVRGVSRDSAAALPQPE